MRNSEIQAVLVESSLRLIQQPRVTWDGGALLEGLAISDWLVAMSVINNIDEGLMWKGLANRERHHP